MAIRHIFSVLLFASISCAGWTGCGQAEKSGLASSSTDQASDGQTSGPARSTVNGPTVNGLTVDGPTVNGVATPVAQVVHNFLEAVRLGETDNASSLLTPLALQRTSELDLSFSPPGSDTAKFTVGTVEMIDQQRAIVQSVWTDLDVDGKPSHEPITWALKRSQAGWRISGMAAEIGSGQPPIVMDFENPQDMMRPEPTKNNSKATLQEANQATSDPFQQPSPR